MRSDSYERIHRTSLSLSLFLHPPPFSLLGTTTARGTDSHTSRVSIKRGRKWRALVDRCGLAHGSAKREKQGEKKHTCATVRPREWVCFAMKKMSSYPSIIIEPRIDVYYHRLLPDPFFTCLPRFHNSVRRGYFYCSDCSVPARGTSRRGREEFIPGQKVVCRADHGVKSRKIGGPAGCPSQYAPYSESRQIGSTSKTILAENCSTNPYIKCPGYRARSREQGQPRP